MIAEIIPEVYDAAGKQVSDPFRKRKGPHPTFPIGRYISQPLTVACTSIDELRKFLAGCEYVSDQELFGKRDYWQPPEEFETRRKGDCEDFALWTWRQLMIMGFEARFVGGGCGRYGGGHAWVEFIQDGKCYLLEPQRSGVTGIMPRFSTIRYEPKFSVSWDGQTLRYFAHKKPATKLGFSQLAPLLAEYVSFWTWFWVRNFYRLPRIGWRMLHRSLFKRELWGIKKTS